MPDAPKKPHLQAAARASVEIAFILFLFYANLLMGEFTRVNSRGKSLVAAVADIVTPTNFVIGVVAAFFGYVFFERLRKRI